MRPFSSNEIQYIREFIEQNKWQIEGHAKNYFRYSISQKTRVILFTFKFPVLLPIRLNIPFEVACFRFSLGFKLWNLNQNAFKIILYVMKMLRNLANQISMEHAFPLKGKENDLVRILNLIIPEEIKNENENAWLNRIRVSLMNKRDQFKEFNTNKINDVVKTLKTLGLDATFEQPWELSKGLPKLRTSETLFFSNGEQEFFILEKGYFTYLKDLAYNKFVIRSFFESYTPYILTTIFQSKENLDFKLEVFVENWIIFARLILNSLIEIIDAGKFNQNEFIKFLPEKELSFDDDLVLKQNNFAFSALFYESKLSKELYPIHNDLMNSPPTNFEIIETLIHYTGAEELIKKYQFEKATNLLNESLKIFNKHHQKKAVVSVLLQLRKIASILNNGEAELNYLQNALGVAKSGDIPVEYIIKIHFKLGKSYFKSKRFLNALDHFNIIINFLENENISIHKQELLGMTHLYKSLIYLESNNASESKKNLKKVFAYGNDSLKVKLKQYLLRAKFLKERGKISQAQKLLRLGIDAIGLELKDEEYKNIQIKLILELAEFYIHLRKDGKRANYLLKSIENHLSLKTIPEIHKSIKWNILTSDFYTIFAKDLKTSYYYLKQAENLKSQLKIFRVLE